MSILKCLLNSALLLNITYFIYRLEPDKLTIG